MRRTALFGIRAVAEAVGVEGRQVVGLVRSGYGDSLAAMVTIRRLERSRPAPGGWEAFRPLGR